MAYYETAYREVKDALNRIDMAIEEILQWLPEDLSIGDNGVAEGIIKMENEVKLLQLKVDKNEREQRTKA